MYNITDNRPMNEQLNIQIGIAGTDLRQSSDFISASSAVYLKMQR